MNKAAILLIEGKHAEHPSFLTPLRKKGFAVEGVSKGGEALRRLKEEGRIDVVIVNAATLRTSGRRICQSLRAAYPNLPLILILDSEHSAKVDDADVILTLPFTVQKLVNRIRHLLPGPGKHSLQVGDVHLDLEKQIVACGERRSRLTPRLARLLAVLMEHPGQVVDRKSLFAQVWETNYTDDTRTLDVHISWLRRAIEEDSRRPRYIKTIRGAGYLFEANVADS
ncbi:MAG: response regulator transcription factor [Anaerolineales bacterium]|nr:response regulator transcription factor [Anaerolineales bacterium]MCX7607909.1 response regulator transcription factor [Anaerolineales bacterium]